MSKMSELDIALRDFHIAADAVIASCKEVMSICEAVRGNDTKAPTAPKPKVLTMEAVRAVLAEKSRNGHTAKVRELLEKHGASKLSEIDPKKYAALLADAEVLGDG